MTVVNWPGLCGLFAWLLVLGFFFAKAEIHIEGEHGWALSLPTWRIEKHWLLDVFWGGRPMTGYHAWVFSFILLFFHLGFFITCSWSVRLELRALASVSWFWIFEDFLWFVLNPALGIRAFRPGHVPWHPRWFCGLPLDYWQFGAGGLILMVATYINW